MKARHTLRSKHRHRWSLLFFLLFLLLASVNINVKAQDYNGGFNVEYFFGNLPSARAEAMGKSSVAIGAGLDAQFLNPASIGNVKVREIALSTSAPFYALRKSNYFYAGYAQRVFPKLAVAAVLHQFNTGTTTFDIGIGGKKYPYLDKPMSTNLSVAAAYEILPDLLVGTNINLYLWGLFKEISRDKTVFIDFGLQYEKQIFKNSELKQNAKFGFSLINATGATLTFSSPDDLQSTQPFPIIGRFGIAYERNGKISIPKAGSGDFDFIFTIEHQNVFNYDYRTSFQLGAEAIFWKVLAVRAGFISQDNDDGGRPEFNRDKASAPTYGLGTIVPVSEMGKGKVPFDVHIDYTTIKPLDFSILFGRPTNVRTFTVRLVWTKTDKK